VGFASIITALVSRENNNGGDGAFVCNKTRYELEIVVAKAVENIDLESLSLNNNLQT
jgi:hypothetical protein